jgi:hypothetical protein
MQLPQFTPNQITVKARFFQSRNFLLDAMIALYIKLES